MDVIIAAPVGVVSSRSMPLEYMRASLRSSEVTGAGTWNLPCDISTYPLPVSMGDETTFSIPSKSRQITAPTISTIVSMCPTSWKCTSSTGQLCTTASASARLRKMERLLSFIEASSLLSVTISRRSLNGLPGRSLLSITTSTFVALIPFFSTVDAVIAYPSRFN